MHRVDVPRYVKEHLSDGEEVIGKFSSVSTDLYATKSRIVGFARPNWWVLFLFVGLVPGIIALL